MIMGLGFSFLKCRSGAIAGISSGGLRLVFLMAMKSKIEGDVLSKSGGVIQVNHEVGFALLLVLFLAGVALNIILLLQTRTLPQAVWKPGGGFRFCTQSGSKNPTTDSFSTDCGARIG